jgi:protoporphyrinogen IX oxidase
MVVAATLYDWLLFLHLLGAMTWFGGVLTSGRLATQVLRGGDSAAIARFIGNLRLIGPFVFAPAMLAVLGFGIWMVVDGDEVRFAQTWIRLALVLFAAAFLIGAVFQSWVAIGAQRAAAGGDGDEAARQLRRWVWGTRLIFLLLVVAVWDMAIKPGL